MTHHQTVLDYVRAEPFRPFRIHMASGRTFDVRHPEMIKVLRSWLIVFRTNGSVTDIPEGFDSLSLTLVESISHLDSAVRVDGG